MLYDFQLGPLSEVLTIANLRHAASRIWTCAKLSSGFDEWSCAVVITTTPQRKLLQKLFSNFCLIAALSTCDLIGVINDMSSDLKPCLLEINSNGELKREHLESSSSATKNISPLPQCLWPPNLAGFWHTMTGSNPENHMAFGSHGLARLHDKLKSF